MDAVQALILSALFALTIGAYVYTYHSIRMLIGMILEDRLRVDTKLDLLLVAVTRATTILERVFPALKVGEK